MAPAYDAADDDELIGEDPFEEPAAKRIVMLVSVRSRARTAPPPHPRERSTDDWIDDASSFDLATARPSRP
jgi:hypothetical protein